MNHSLQSYRSLALLFFCSMFLLTSCTTNTENEKTRIQQVNPSANQAAIKVGKEFTYPQVTVHMSSDGDLWVPLKESASSLDYVYKWNPSTQSFKMGYRDIQYSLHMGSSTAQTDAGEVVLPRAPRMIGENPYITITALEKLWGTNVRWNPSQKSMVITPINDVAISNKTSAQIQSNLKDVDENALISDAHRFLGVPYLFGADPYEQSRRFDCSSYTRHIYKNFGVNLPRTARAQSKLGHPVSFNNLKPGDMLFFYVPGRFKTNRTVGHNAIYIGDGKIIHTFGKLGVTVSTVNSGYWRDKFLFAKRLVN